MSVVKRRSNFWFLLPFFFGIIGGLIGYFIIKGDDPEKAKQVLAVGVVILAITIAINLAQFGILISSTDSGFELISPLSMLN